MKGIEAWGFPQKKGNKRPFTGGGLLGRVGRKVEGGEKKGRD